MKEDEGSNYMARNAISILQELRGGDCVMELTDKLNEATAAAMQTGKKAVVTIKLTITPQGAQALVKDDIETKNPEFPVQPTVMFVDDYSNLTRQSPTQLSLLKGSVRLNKSSGEPVKVEDKEESVRVDPETGEVIRVE